MRRQGASAGERTRRVVPGPEPMEIAAMIPGDIATGRGTRRSRASVWPWLAVLLLVGCAPEGPDPAAATAPARPEEPTVTDAAAPLPEGAIRQMVYVPTYSHIYVQDGTREIDLAATLSIRNTDPDRAITLTDVSYFNSTGQLVRRYLEQALRLQPLSSRAFVIEERDKVGGVGANFIVEWQSEAHVSSPIIEAVMISTASTQGISFVSRGQVVRPLEGDSLR